MCYSVFMCCLIITSPVVNNALREVPQWIVGCNKCVTKHKNELSYLKWFVFNSNNITPVGNVLFVNLMPDPVALHVNVRMNS